MKLTEIERCKEIARRRYGVTPEVTIRWDLRGMTAGWCEYQDDGSSIIRLNADVALAEGDAFASTIAHEYAHAVDWALDHDEGCARKREHHGARWRLIMRIFGHPPLRCHSYESAVPVRVVEKFKYRCGCREVHLVGPKVHAKLQRGAIYFCRKCRTRLIAAPVATSEDLLARFK